MTGQTKMIIITSDEDIIRQFSLNKTTNTHIIDLDNNKQVTSTAKDNNNIINLDFLSQLSELSSTNDRVYKRALDSSDQNQSRPIKASKKTIDMICAICGDRAVGFNYDVLSCASCKVFFHRNAHLDLEKIKCLTGQGQCLVAYGTRRRCKRCRLDRCFAMGMRRDFMLSEEEKQQRRRKRLEENRNNSSTSTTNPLLNSESISHTFEEIDRILMDDDDDDNDIIDLHENVHSDQMNDTALETLSIEDWITIQDVQSSFVSLFGGDTIQCRCVDVSDRTSALITWSQFVQKCFLRFISFFRQINEFEDLHVDDRFILIKYNMFHIFLLSKCFHYDPKDDCCSNGDNEVAVKNRRFFMLCGAPNGFRDSYVSVVLSLVELTKQDPTILSLLSIILMFSRGLSLNENEPSLKDPSAIHRAQSRYTQVLWNYLVSKQGEMEACRYFNKLLKMIFRMRSVTNGFHEFFRVQYMASDNGDKIAPLLQTVLQIS